MTSVTWSMLSMETVRARLRQRAPARRAPLLRQEPTPGYGPIPTPKGLVPTVIVVTTGCWLVMGALGRVGAPATRPGLVAADAGVGAPTTVLVVVSSTFTVLS